MKEKNFLKEDREMKTKRMTFTVILSLLALVAVLLFAPWGEREAKAYGTDALTTLTNIATLSWTGGTDAKTNTGQDVGTNIGIIWVSTSDGSDDVTAGNTVINQSYLTNYGNASNEFVLTVESNYNDSSASNWTIVFTNYAGGAASGTLTVSDVSPGAAPHIGLFVTVPTGETNGAAMTFRCLASNTTFSAANITNYVGHNSINYGGNVGEWGAGGGNTYLSNLAVAADFTNWVVTVQAPTITLTLNAGFTNPQPYASQTGNPVPGALITYRLYITNEGSADATNIQLANAIPANTAYGNESMRVGTDNVALADYAGGATAALVDAQNNDEGWEDGTTIRFYPNGDDAVGTSGNLSANGERTFFFRVTLN